jgi:hypothetical protein
MAKAAPGDAQQHLAQQHPAKVLEDSTAWARPAVAEHLNARTHPAEVAARVVRERAYRAVQHGGDENRILREREAWLHSLDRKYGIVR